MTSPYHLNGLLLGYGMVRVRDRLLRESTRYQQGKDEW